MWFVMYEKLIKYLRVCSSEAEDIDCCCGCPFNGRHDSICLDMLMGAAADAIEKLTGENEVEIDYEGPKEN